jgi:TetR/AcrR family transcriptional repressor of nem operon
MLNKGHETRNRILRESRKLFTIKGFQNTSISEVITVTGVKKGNLYYYFQSKEELGIAVLLDAAREFSAILDQSLTGDNPIRKIIHSCQTIMEMMQQAHFVGGCLFGNTALEMSGTNNRFGEILQDVFKNWTDKLKTELQNAEISGLLNTQLTVDVLAVSIVAILEGGIMLSRVYENKQALEHCILTIKTLLEPEQP